MYSRIKMELKEYLEKKNFSYSKSGDVEMITMDDYSFYVKGTDVHIPIPLPTGKEKLDDLVTMGTYYARASRLVQGIGMPVTYALRETTVEVIVHFNDRNELEQKLIKALEGIESLRYFM
ncbi:MAG: hypothetical protein QXX62_00470 [Metallosphaera sp.]|uniref:Uncharacterized protein n=4 Tax=Metallosphaera TaxID=41980 RepID=A4YH05_METS5|nr:hypothetical protein [Metallosphaera prunae]ABP95707.1 hypothetical protein Msed_1552 [Metallosphaera sedula DSM 5348]AIM27691.1 hypothetical protein HA72_1552 [Metallosphaera sedula]WPX05550.1 hypothetical protein SOJ17_001531 [Metallosphaera sedula DSM 5348]BBL47668.1 hypothetical protein MJ1HA_1769 [Metallosphaera sedula]